jgi:arylsulfatase
MIIAGSGVDRVAQINRAYVTVMDLAPTFIARARAQYPGDGSVQPMLGESMVPFLAGASDRVHAPDYVTAQFHRNRAYLRQGRWKITQIEVPFTESGFELYDLETDPGETTDLAGTQPEKYSELTALWRQQVKQLGIILPGDL